MRIAEINDETMSRFKAILIESGFVAGAREDDVLSFLGNRDNLVYMGAFVGEEIAGIVSLTFGRSSYRLSPFAWCDDLYVRESYRRMGVGRRLVEKAVEIAREKECSNILLGVGQDREHVLSFYEALGFKDMKCNLMTLVL
jgi:ribosomal protein S18 acetylase RimI-like enzyme